MDRAETIALLSRIRVVLADAFANRLRGVVLYGSQARGDARRVHQVGRVERRPEQAVFRVPAFDHPHRRFPDRAHGVRPCLQGEGSHGMPPCGRVSASRVERVKRRPGRVCRFGKANL